MRKNSKVATIQASLDFLQQIQTQQKSNNELQETLIDADSEIQKNNADLQNLKKQLSSPNNTDYASQSLATLQAQLEKLTNQQQDATICIKCREYTTCRAKRCIRTRPNSLNR